MPSRSPPQHDEHGWVVVDHELLSRLGPHSPSAEWQRTLKRTGLWDLEGLDGNEGRDLAEVRAAVASGLVADISGAADLALAPSAAQVGAETGRIVGVALVMAVGLWLAGMPGFAGLAVVVGVGLVVNVVRSRPARRLAGPLGWPADRATRALRRFLSHSFITTAGDRIVENTPHRAYLQLRLEEVDRALKLTAAQVEELREVRTRVAQANVRIGRSAEDVETARLTTAIAEKEAARERVAGVRALLAERLADMERQLDRLRLVVERRALSERVSRLTDAGARQDPVERVAAEVEVDVAEIERRVRDLALEAGDADARLRAVLEVVNAGPARV